MKIFYIAYFDFLRVLKDKMAVFWMLVMPLGFIYMFGLMIQHRGEVNTWLPIVDLDQSDLSTVFIENLKKEHFNIDIRPATDEINVQYWDRAVIIPATFTVSIMNGEKGVIAFTKKEGQGAQDTLHAQVHLYNTLAKFNGALASENVIGKPLSLPLLNRIDAKMKAPNQLQVSHASDSSLRPPPIGFALTLPGYLIMFVLMINIMYGAITLIDDRNGKQLLRLSATPLSTMEIFCGKLLGRIIIPFAQAMIMLSVGYLLLDVDLGDHPLALVPLLIAYSICCASIGLLFGVLFNSETQVTSFGTLFSMFAAALGGCWWPIELVPETVRNFGKLFPTYWGLNGMHDIMSFGKSIESIMFEIIILIIFSIIFIAVSIPLYIKLSSN